MSESDKAKVAELLSITGDDGEYRVKYDHLTITPEEAARKLSCHGDIGRVAVKDYGDKYLAVASSKNTKVVAAIICNILAPYVA